MTRLCGYLLPLALLVAALGSTVFSGALWQTAIVVAILLVAGLEVRGLARRYRHDHGSWWL